MTLRTLCLLGALLLLLLSAACGGAEAPAPTATPVPPTATTPAEQPAEPSAEPTPAAAAGVTTFVIVPAESRASYMVTEEFFEGALEKLGISAGLADVVGSTQQIGGQIQIDLGDLSAPPGENRFTVQLNTLATTRSARDRWIRENGPEFNRYPQAEFVASTLAGLPAAVASGDTVTFQMIGELTIREVTQPATFDVTATLDGDTLTGNATTSFLMSDFGIDPPSFVNTLTVADPVTVEVAFTARAEG